MDASHNVGGSWSSGKLVHNVNLLGPELADELRWLANSEPEGFTRLVEALSEGNRAIESALLRRWRVRRC